MRFPAPRPAVVVLAAIEIKNDIVDETIKIIVLHTTHIIYYIYDKNDETLGRVRVFRH